MKEGITGSGLSSPRYSSEFNVLKTAGGMGAALSSGKASPSTASLEKNADAGAPVFLASARLRNTWCELSERPDKSKAGEYKKESQSEPVPSRHFNVTGDKKLFSDSHDSTEQFNLKGKVFEKTEKPSVTAQEFTSVSRTVESCTDTGALKSLLESQTVPTFNIVSKTSVKTEAQSSSQLLSSPSAAMNEVSRNLKTTASSGVSESSQLFNIKSSVMSASTLLLSSGTSESAIKPNLITTNTPVFTSESLQKTATTLSAQLFTTIPQQTAVKAKETTQQLTAFTSQATAAVKETAQPLTTIVQQTAVKAKETTQQLTAFTSQATAAVKETAQPLTTIVQQTAVKAKETTQQLTAFTSQATAAVKETAQPLTTIVQQTAVKAKETTQQLTAFTSQATAAVKETAQPLTPLVQQTGLSPSILLPKASSSPDRLQTQGVLLTGSTPGEAAMPEGLNALNIEEKISCSDEISELNTGRASRQQYDDTMIHNENALQKFEKMAGQKLIYGTPLAPQTVENTLSYAPFAQSSLWDSLRLIWKTFLSSTEADLQEYYSPPSEPYFRRGEEKGQKYAASAGLMNQDAVLTLPVRAYSESDSKKQAKSGEKSPEKTSGKEGADKGSLLMHDEKTAALHIPDSEEEQNEEDGGERSRGGGDRKEGKNQEKEGKKDRDQGKGKDGRSDDEEEKKKDKDGDGEDKDEPVSAEKGHERESEMKDGDRALEMLESLSSEINGKKSAAEARGEEHVSGDSDEYLPMWDFRDSADITCSSRYYRNRQRYRKISESCPPCHCAGSMQLTCDTQMPPGPVPSFPLFAQLYAESTSPMGIHQMPPPKVFTNHDMLRQHLLEMLEMSVFQPLRMTARASRFAASAIGDIIRKRYRLKDITKDYFASYVAMLMRISGEFTFSHSLRTMDLALEIARKAMIDDEEIMEQVRFGAFFKDIGELDFLLSRLPIKEKESIAGFLASRDLKWAGILHDIGKIRIPREVLYKPGALSDEEFRIMKMHPIYSEQILYPILSLRFLCPVVRAHHERWDGKGYPDRLEGNTIPVAARIIAIADVFDALISDRPYKKGMAWPKVKKIMTEGRGTHFDPHLLDIFLSHITPLHERA
ncbi:MAG: HD domain-containing phosphohydrolase [Candidatus Xenobiia bacterium LiM19]